MTFIPKSTSPNATGDSNEVLVVGTDGDGNPRNVLLRNAPELKASILAGIESARIQREELERSIVAARATVDQPAFDAAIAEVAAEEEAARLIEEERARNAAEAAANQTRLNTEASVPA